MYVHSGLRVGHADRARPGVSTRPGVGRSPARIIDNSRDGPYSEHLRRSVKSIETVRPQRLLVTNNDTIGSTGPGTTPRTRPTISRSREQTGRTEAIRVFPPGRKTRGSLTPGVAYAAYVFTVPSWCDFYSIRRRRFRSILSFRPTPIVKITNANQTIQYVVRALLSKFVRAVCTPTGKQLLIDTSTGRFERIRGVKTRRGNILAVGVGRRFRTIISTPSVP